MVPSHSQGSPPQRSLFGGIDGGILRDYCKEIDAQQIVMSWQKIPPPLSVANHLQTSHFCQFAAAHRGPRRANFCENYCDLSGQNTPVLDQFRYNFCENFSECFMASISPRLP